MKPKKLFSLFLSIAMAATLLVLPMTTGAKTTTSALAEESGTTEKNIALGVSQVNGAQGSNIYFGAYKQTSDGSGGYNVDPVKWRTLSNADDKLFLLSDQNIEILQFHESNVNSVTWEDSTIRSWLNGYGSTINAAGKDYTSDNFLGTAFSTDEQTAILNSLIVNATAAGCSSSGNDTTDKVFFAVGGRGENDGVRI